MSKETDDFTCERSRSAPTLAHVLLAGKKKTQFVDTIATSGQLTSGLFTVSDVVQFFDGGDIVINEETFRINMGDALPLTSMCLLRVDLPCSVRVRCFYVNDGLRDEHFPGKICWVHRFQLGGETVRCHDNVLSRLPKGTPLHPDEIDLTPALAHLVAASSEEAHDTTTE